VKILIAEDSSTVRRVVAGRLAADGYQVVEAVDGEDALKLARQGLSRPGWCHPGWRHPGRDTLPGAARPLAR
jgi:CheY-like chemotaxis protein